MISCFFLPIITLMYSHCDTCFDALLCMLISGNYIFFLFGISHYLFHQNVWVIITKSLFEPALFTYFILLLTALILIEPRKTFCYGVIFICCLLLMYIACEIFAIKHLPINPIYVTNKFLSYPLYHFYFHLSIFWIPIFLDVKYLGQVPANMGQTLK